MKPAGCPGAPRRAGGLQEREGAYDVRLDEYVGVGNRAIDVGLRCEMNDCIDGVRSKKGTYEVSVTDIAMNEPVSTFRGLEDVPPCAGVRQKVEYDDLGGRVASDEGAHKIGTDEAGSTCHENPQRNVVSH